MDSYIGTIMAWAPDFAPMDWMFCQGQSLPVSQYQALYSLIGIKYGGDGRTNFNLPDLRGRIPVGAGVNPKTNTPYIQGEVGGLERYTLNSTNLPQHIHTINSTATATANTANVSMNISIPVVGTYSTDTRVDIPDSNASLGVSRSAANQAIYAYSNGDTTSSLKPFTATSTVTVPAQNVTVTSTCVPSSTPAAAFDVRQPYLCVNYIICVNGLYPMRN